jgi:hypothetical protein
MAVLRDAASRLLRMRTVDNPYSDAALNPAPALLSTIEAWIPGSASRPGVTTGRVVSITAAN